MKVLMHTELRRGKWRFTVLDTKVPRPYALQVLTEDASFLDIATTRPLPHEDAYALIATSQSALPQFHFVAKPVSRRRSAVWAVLDTPCADKNDLPSEFIFDRRRKHTPRTPSVSADRLLAAERALRSRRPGGYEWRRADRAADIVRSEGVLHYRVKRSSLMSGVLLEAWPMRDAHLRALMSDPAAHEVFQLGILYTLPMPREQRAKAQCENIKNAPVVRAHPGRYDARVVPFTKNVGRFRSQEWRVRTMGRRQDLEELRVQLGLPEILLREGCPQRRSDPLRQHAGWLSYMAFPAGLELRDDEPVAAQGLLGVDRERARYVQSDTESVYRVWRALTTPYVLDHLLFTLDYEAWFYDPESPEHTGQVNQGILASRFERILFTALDIGVSHLDGAEVIHASCETGLAADIDRESIPLLVHFTKYEEESTRAFQVKGPKALADSVQMMRHRYAESGVPLREVDVARKFADNARRRAERRALKIPLSRRLVSLRQSRLDLHAYVRNRANILPNLKLATVVRGRKPFDHAVLEEGYRSGDLDQWLRNSKYTVQDGVMTHAGAVDFYRLASLEMIATGLPLVQVGRHTPFSLWDRMRWREVMAAMQFFRDGWYHSNRIFEERREMQLEPGQFWQRVLLPQGGPQFVERAVMGMPRDFFTVFEPAYRANPTMSVLLDAVEDEFVDEVSRCAAVSALHGFGQIMLTLVRKAWRRRHRERDLELGTRVSCEDFYQLSRFEQSQGAFHVDEDAAETALLEYIFNQAFRWSAPDIPTSQVVTPNGDHWDWQHSLWYYGDRLTESVRYWRNRTVYATHKHGILTDHPERLIVYGSGPAAILGASKAVMKTPRYTLAPGTYIPPDVDGRGVLHLADVLFTHGPGDAYRAVLTDLLQDPPPRQAENLEAFAALLQRSGVLQGELFG